MRVDFTAHKGLLMGNAGGNPRMKSFCECAHNVMHNATASLLGSHGRDAAHLHESNAAVVRYTEKTLAEVRRVCGGLAEEVIDNLTLPIVNFEYYPQSSTPRRKRTRSPSSTAAPAPRSRS